jgi:hypothetical protein
MKKAMTRRVTTGKERVEQRILGRSEVAAIMDGFTVTFDIIAPLAWIIH